MKLQVGALYKLNNRPTLHPKDKTARLCHYEGELLVYLQVMVDLVTVDLVMVDLVTVDLVMVDLQAASLSSPQWHTVHIQKYGIVDVYMFSSSFKLISEVPE